MARVNIFLITVALVVGMVGYGGTCGVYNPPPSENLEIRTWYDLDAVRDNLGGHHRLMNDLDSTTAGYDELASPTANQGKGWQPIGTSAYNLFWGEFDGQGYEIRDLFINRPHEYYVGLFGLAGYRGVIKDVGVVNFTVSGSNRVGGLVGENWGTVSNSYATGRVSGSSCVGGLVGKNEDTVSNSYSTASVTGDYHVGSLVGWNEGPVSDSYATGSVSGDMNIGGLVGINSGTVSNSYSTGNVTGSVYVGGLVGRNLWGTVSDSYSTASVTGDEDVGGLVGWSYDSTVSNSFWDIVTSGQATSVGGTGKTTAEMKTIATFIAWDIIAVTSGQTNTTHTWNIVDGETYPFLSWEQ